MVDHFYIVLGGFLMLQAIVEVILKKAYVRTDWRWEFDWVTKEERPHRYWSSIVFKAILGMFLTGVWTRAMILSQAGM